MKSILKRIVIGLFLPSLVEQRKYMTRQECFVYWLFQRVLRINASVPWPVHWSSWISFPEKIALRSTFRPPGFAPGNYIQAINGISFGKNVWIAPGVQIISADHDLYDYDKHAAAQPIEIGGVPARLLKRLGPYGSPAP